MKVQITAGMFMAIVINMIYSKAIGVTQGTMAREVGSDIWISTVIASIIAAVFMLVTVHVMKRVPNADITHQIGTKKSTWLIKGISIIVFLFFLMSFVPVMATFVYHLKDYFLPEAPVWIFIVVAMVVGSYGIFFGLEVVGRMALIGVFSILALNILLLLGSLENFDIRELLPVFTSGFLPTVWASRHHLADWTFPIMMSFVILPFVRAREKWSRISVTSVFFGMMFIVMWPILETGVLSAEVAAQYIVSCMQMARSAEIGLYIHRYEMIMIALFAISLLTQVMISIFCATMALKNFMSINDYRSLIIPVSIIFGGFSYWMVSDHQRAMKFIEETWVYYAVGFALVTPVLVWIIGIVFKNRWKKLEEQET